MFDFCSGFVSDFYCKLADVLALLRSTIHDGIADETLPFLLQLGCGHGLPGIFACLKVRYIISVVDSSSELTSDASIWGHPSRIFHAFGLYWK